MKYGVVKYGFFAAGCLLVADASDARAAVAAAPAATTADPVDQLKLPYERFTLPNGLTVIVYTDHSAPTVLVSLTYRVGSKDEPEGKTGFAHLFEHMMFQETPNRKDEYFSRLNQAGAININGNTTTDRTRYFEIIPTQALDLALWMESDRMQYLLGAIDAKALDSQRAVVKNEKRQHGTAASDAQSDAFLAALYPANHPYAHSTIGSMRDLDAASVEDARSWFDSYYGASNAILLLAGDIDASTAREKVAKYFKDVRPGSRTQSIARWVPTLGEHKDLHFYGKDGHVTLSRTWPVPSGDEREGTLLNLMASTLSGSPDAPLNAALVEHDGPALSVGAIFQDSFVNGIFTVSVDLKPGADIAEVERRIDAVMAAQLRDGPNARMLQQYRRTADKDLLAGLEDPQSVGGILEEGELAGGDPLLFKTERRWQTEATPATIAAVARKWLTRPYITTRTDPEPTTTPAVADSVDRTRSPAVAATPAVTGASPATLPPIERATLSNGAQLVVVRRPKLPLVSVTFAFATGRFIGRDYPRGLSSLTLGSLFEGSKRYPAETIKATMRDLALYPVGIGDQRQSSVTFSTDSASLDQATAFTTEVLREPLFPQKKVDEHRLAVDQSFDSYERNPSGALEAVFSQALWGKDHPVGHIETRDEAKSISRAAMLDFYQHELSPANMTAYFVGDITLEHARALMEANLAGWHQGVKPAPTVDVPAARPTGVRVVLIDIPGATQSQVLGGRLMEMWEPRRSMAEVLANGALGGAFTSRINLNLREDKGWTYGIRSNLGGSLRSQRTFYVKGAIQADHTADAIREVLREIRDFNADRPLTATELQDQKTTVLNKLKTVLTSNRNYVMAMMDAQERGMPLDYLQSMPAVIDSITLDEAQKVARETFHADDFVWAIAGDLRKIEPEIRALNLGPVEVQDVYGHRIR
ncbi:peptidase M16 [Sphingomonas metalli]|uniref:Peptidase M16 n=1 Tax=Sphingomonas metalli TaxID=1779358 RepID=A0A916TEP8_9SPHN|nr:pitrilysin family protein [Sphingomonas metalli]GGB41270.1 peptidase M16 [Sphingomonas metalli]